MSKITHTVGEAAQLLGIGRSAAYEAARTGQLPTIRIGKRILVPKAAFERLLRIASDAESPPNGSTDVRLRPDGMRHDR